jgi:hypothetical protein
VKQRIWDDKEVDLGVTFETLVARQCVCYVTTFARLDVCLSLNQFFLVVVVVVVVVLSSGFFSLRWGKIRGRPPNSTRPQFP